MTQSKITPKPKNAQVYKEAVELGKKLSKNPDMTKTAVSMKMYELIHEESREVIAQAFVEGANLTEKGAVTYFYNCKRRFAKG